jgi:predicted phosphodiesterase
MADSHGQPGTISAALNLFKDKGCAKIYHLGDICDSSHPETADTCIQLLQQNNVVAIKGNNDRTIETNHIKQKKSCISKASLLYLQKLPLVIEYKEVIFAHSLPFAKKLGLSCMIRIFGKESIKYFFNNYPHTILFRGHSHVPEILWVKSSDTLSEPLTTGQTVNISNRVPSIITCGSLTQGLCMIWKPEEMYVACFSLAMP